MTDAEDLAIAEALCSHLCHELISPVSAINNGLELLTEEEHGAGMMADALDLMRRSASEASRRLQFYRLAYGMASGFDGDPAFTTVRNLSEGLLAGSKVKVEWGEGSTDPAVHPGRICTKLALNMIALARDALPRGGTITMRATPMDGKLALSVVAAGSGAGFKEEVRAVFDGSAAGVGPRTAQAFLAARLARELGSPLAVDHEAADGVLIGAVVDPGR